MSEPDLLERTKMALAEVGYDPHYVRHGRRSGTVQISFDVPAIERWRAGQIARAHPDGPFICWRHYEPTDHDWHARDAAFTACLADRPLVRDCGITR